MEKSHLLNTKEASKLINQFWSDSVEESLKEFIRIPNLSKHFDENWSVNGL